MKVVSSEPKTKLFEELFFGDCFRYIGVNKILMKMSVPQNVSSRNSIQLDDGFTCKTPDDCRVLPVKGAFFEE